MELKSSHKSFNKLIWPVYLLNGFNSISFAGIIILMVPLSSLIWPGEDYHALEMGILMTTMLWTSSVSGLFFGRLIDKFSRVKILILIAIMRSFCMILLGFAIAGQGLFTWWYFFTVILIFGIFAGGSYPAIVSLSNDIIPLKHRSKFFGYFSIAGSLFMMSGFLISGSLVQFGFWRIYFLGIGIAVLISGLIFYFIVKEPKRGSQNKELQTILMDETIEYDFKMDKNLMRKTMLSRTNIAALIEGIFTNVFLGSLDMIILPYLQTPPHNLSPLITGLFIVIFGVTGRIIGQVVLARFSDKLAEHKGVRRIYFIIFSLIGGSLTFVLMFFVPIPYLTQSEGADIVFFFSLPISYMMGILILSSDAISSLYAVNQPPILQEINLPEGQGQIVSWNQFLENIGYGLGPLIAGIFISTFGQNYQISAIIIAVFVIPGIILWMLSISYYPQDIKRIKDLLKERAQILRKRKIPEQEI
ncbi:MAG: MFS transporter [Candidatus Lokiarchaeota archaeon]|nr:MFS transporter [Candidatus Lokiarchaeota archaeon]